MTDYRDKLKKARLPEGTVSICLRADLVADHELLTQQLEEAKHAKGNSLAGSGVAQKREQLQQLEQEMRDSTQVFRLRGLASRRVGSNAGDPRPTWQELKEQHPPREKDGDMLLADRIAGGVNVDAFAEPLVRWCLIDPVMNESDWAETLAVLSEGQFDALVTKAWILNQRDVSIPFSSAASQQNRNSGGE